MRMFTLVGALSVMLANSFAVAVIYGQEKPPAEVQPKPADAQPKPADAQPKLDAEQAAKPAPLDPSILESTYDQLWLHLSEHYAGSLPPDWAKWRDRFKGKLTSIGELRAASSLLVAALGDRAARTLNEEQVEEHLCHLESGYVGIGLRFKPLNLINQGLLIKRVADGGTASGAGLTAGMVISAVDGVSLKGLRWETAEALFAGEEGSRMKLSLKDCSKNEVIIVRDPHKPLGLDVELASPTKLFEIDHVMYDSPAARAGVKEGDIVTHINGNAVEGGSSWWLMNQATGGKMGDIITLTLKRGDEMPRLVELKRAIVETWDDAFGAGSQNFGGPGDHGLTEIALKNLDWVRCLKWVDREVESMNRYAGVILDLRGCGGNDPELAARVAARFVCDGEVLRYRTRIGAKWEEVSYRVAPEKGGTTLYRHLSHDAGQPEESKAVETVSKPVLNARMVVIVDERTSGTAVALATTLKKHGRATIVGRTTSGVNRLVSTTTFPVGNELLYAQVPTMTLLSLTNLPLSPLKPDRTLWYGKGMDLAKDELAGKYWYNDPNTIACAVMLGIVLVVSGLLYRAGKKASRLAAEEPAPASVQEGPTSLWSRVWPLGFVFLCLGIFLTAGLITRHARQTPPQGAHPELVAELHLNPEKHKEQERLFLQLSKEIEGPITFKVVPDKDADNWIYAGITVRYQWVDKDGKVLSSGSGSQGAENKEAMVQAIEMAQTNLGYQYENPGLRLLTWHKQTPVLIGGEKNDD